MWRSQSGLVNRHPTCYPVVIRVGGDALEPSWSTHAHINHKLLASITAYPPTVPLHHGSPPLYGPNEAANPMLRSSNPAPIQPSDTYIFLSFPHKCCSQRIIHVIVKRIFLPSHSQAFFQRDKSLVFLQQVDLVSVTEKREREAS